MSSTKQHRKVWPGALLALAVTLAAAVLRRQASPTAAKFSLGGGRLLPPPAPPPAPLPTCDLTLGGDPRWSKRCDLLTDVCVDQGTFVLQGTQYQPAPGRPGAPLPVLRAPPAGAPYVLPWTGDVLADLSMEMEAGRPYKSVFQPPPVRAARAREGTSDLAHPTFSSCTLPVVWLPLWQENFAHVYAQTAAVLHSLLSAAPWAPHVKLVVTTPEGLAMPAHVPGLLAPLTSLSIESLADFSARGTPAMGLGSQQTGTARRDSYEGGRPRCFRQLYWCGAQLLGGPYPVTAYGQHLLRHHGYTLPPHAPNGTWATPHSSGASLGNRTAVGAPASAAQPHMQRQQQRPLRVLFQHRAGPARQLLNVNELVDACNTWRPQPTGTQPLRANCSQVALNSLAGTMAAAQEADVFVGMHGANLMSGFIMRPGSIVVEVRPYAFKYNVFQGTAKQDPNLTTSWWVVEVEDPALSQPGPYEAGKHKARRFWARDRSARLPWDALRVVLEAAVAEAPRGSTEAYRAAAAAGSQVWTLLPGRRMRRAGGAEEPY